MSALEMMRPISERQKWVDSVEKVRVAAVLKHFSIRHVEPSAFELAASPAFDVFRGASLLYGIGFSPPSMGSG
ncbi:hypothetical protein, partial [Mesorhizobium sp. M0768]|uniref:hypothetical protein n=1 Tax=Mesorhizobium sp. M0768 TaxID=2956996 RepID=UPI00333D4471